MTTGVKSTGLWSKKQDSKTTTQDKAPPLKGVRVFKRQHLSCYLGSSYELRASHVTHLFSQCWQPTAGKDHKPLKSLSLSRGERGRWGAVSENRLTHRHGWRWLEKLGLPTVAD